MRILKKVLWIWLFVLAFSLFNCSDDCNCPKSITAINPFALTGEVISYNLFGSNSRNYSKATNDTTTSIKGFYGGFGMDYSTERTALQMKLRNTNFSLISSAYACDCALGDYYVLKNVYPVSLKVYTIYAINDTITENSLVNEHLVIKGNYRAIMKEDNIKINTDILLNTNLNDIGGFEVQFLLNYNLIQSDSLQFRIETELNTGEILTTETPLVRFQN